MKKSIGTFILIAFGCVAFFALIAWQTQAQRLFMGNAGLETRKDIPPGLQARILADRESDTGSRTDLSTLPHAFPEVGTTIYAYDELNNRLVSFDAATPGTYITDIPLTGIDVANDEFLQSIDFRPSNGLLYAIVSKSPVGRDRVVTIDLATGAAVPVSTTNTVAPLPDIFWALDFDPVTDRLRAVGTSENNRRLNPNDSTLAGTDTTIRYAVGDPNFGANPNLAHSAYTMSVPLTNTTLYGIDVTANVLVRIGGVNGTPSPSNGELTTIGPLGLDPTNFGSMDIQQGTNTAYAALLIAGVPTLVQINLTTGAASVIGTIGDGNGIIDGLSIPLVPSVQPTPSPTPTGSPAPSPTPIPSPTPTPTATATPRTTPTPVPTPTPTPIPPNASIVRAVSVLGFPGQPVSVNFELQARGGEKSAKFSFRFNPAVLTSPVVSLPPQAAAAGLATDLSEIADGRIGINFDSPTPYPAGTHRILTVTFNVSPSSAAGTYPISYVSSPVPFEIRDGSGNVLPWWFEQGSVANATTAAGVEVSGRVLTPDGRGLRNASVSIARSDGTRRVVTTSSFGYYRFEDVDAGGSYVVSVGSKRYNFSPRVLQVVDTLTDVDFIAN